MLLKNLIKNISKDNEKIIINGVSTNSKKVKKILFFSPLKEKKLTEKNILKKQLTMELQSLFVQKPIKLNKKFLPSKQIK